MQKVAALCHFLASDASNGITGKLISAVWDDWEHWPEHLDELNSSDVYTLRRIAGRDRGFRGGTNEILASGLSAAGLSAKNGPSALGAGRLGGLRGYR